MKRGVRYSTTYRYTTSTTEAMTKAWNTVHFTLGYIDLAKKKLKKFNFFFYYSEHVKNCAAMGTHF